jgi:hypothetical protein
MFMYVCNTLRFAYYTRRYMEAVQHLEGEMNRVGMGLALITLSLDQLHEIVNTQVSHQCIHCSSHSCCH